MSEPSDVTRLLQQLGRHDAAAADLLPMVYETLRSIARARLRRERPDHTLQATALVHEAYVRLLGSEPVPWEHRAHFFAVASEAMRRVLIDHARRHRSKKRGGDRAAVPLSVLDLAAPSDLEQTLALDEALTRLEAEDAKAAQVVKLRFFAGLDVEETAAALGVSERTVAREWAFARARLFELLGQSEDGSS